MRRRRQALQVQTFPFLAVLLCTMGSLILLLLVIDRRAKAAARTKLLQAAQETVRKQTEAEAQAAAARQAEWDRKRQELHALLARQEEDLRQKIEAVQTQATAAAGKLAAEQARHAGLLHRLQDEQGLLAKDRQDLDARRAALQEAAGMEDGAKKEVARLAAELAHLEEALAGLKALRRREQQTYSVVPYLGKRGEGRRPLYVECAAGTVVFHPDHLALGGSDLSALAVRRELDRRLAEQQKTVGAAAAPYLLLLVRPSGIESYYLMKTALAGLQIDYGYELIDQDWVLDLSEGAQLAQGPAGRSGLESKIPPAPLATLRPPAPHGTAGARLAPPGMAVAPSGPGGRAGRASSGSAMLGTPTGLESSSSASAGPSGGPGSRGGSASVGLGLAGVPGGAEGSAPGRAAGTSAMTGPVLGGGSGGSAGLPGIGFTSVAAAGPPSLAVAAGPGLGGGGEVPGPPRMPTAPGSGTGPANGSPQGGEGPGAYGPRGPGLPGQGVAGSSAGGNAATGAAGSGGPDAGPGSPNASTVGVPPGQTGSLAGGATGASAGQGPAPLIPGPPTQGPSRIGVQGSQSQGEPSTPGTAPGPVSLLPDARNSPRAPVPLGRLIASRDWIIPVECRADSVTVLSTGMQYSLADLRPAAGRTNPLVDAVRQLIDRRQATVRPGEAPYRPVLRFRVWPDGLRSYYAANGLLETLRMPTIRENVETERRAVPDLLRP
jgi:hypothetical protein